MVGLCGYGIFFEQVLHICILNAKSLIGQRTATKTWYVLCLKTSQLKYYFLPGQRVAGLLSQRLYLHWTSLLMIRNSDLTLVLHQCCCLKCLSLMHHAPFTNKNWCCNKKSCKFWSVSCYYCCCIFRRRRCLISTGLQGFLPLLVQGASWFPTAPNDLLAPPVSCRSISICFATVCRTVKLQFSSIDKLLRQNFQPFTITTFTTPLRICNFAPSEEIVDKI